MKILLVTPPMTQLNSPYPATPYLLGGLKKTYKNVTQADFSLNLALKIFSKKGLKKIFVEAKRNQRKLSSQTRWMLAHERRYVELIEDVIRLLQKKKMSYLMKRIVQDRFLPENPLRSHQSPEGRVFLDNLKHVFQDLEYDEQARHLSSLMLGDLTKLIQEAVDSRFALSKWGEALASNQATFEELDDALSHKHNLLDRFLYELVEDKILSKKWDLVGLTVPFPGNVYGAFRIAQMIKAFNPEIKTVLGGGFVNTELRSLKEPRVFDYFDYVTLDDGFRPLELICENILNASSLPKLKRTYQKVKKQVLFVDNVPHLHDQPFSEVGAPDYKGLNFSDYLCLLEVPNPMHRLWSDEKWNKLIVAHGCYWKKCTFCDVSLDYIRRFETTPAENFVNHMEALIEQTGERGFHFVDEAAPPAALKAIAEEIIKRKLEVTWWGNIRFEKSFTQELATLLRESGCIAVTGGLEVASNRLLKLIKKGVTVEQVAQVTKNFADAGILVHAYLMYGFPSQTLQEFSDSLELVRQLFEQGCIHSGFWHQFAATAHSPVGLAPDAFGVKLKAPQNVKFAKNEVFYTEKESIRWRDFDAGLAKSMYNFMLGVGWDFDVRHWFDKRIPRPKVSKDFILQALLAREVAA